MSEDYIPMLRELILDEASFIQATFSGRQRGQTLAWKRLVIRPVLLKEKRHLQFTFFDEAKSISKNYAEAEATSQLDEALALPFRNFHVQTVSENIQINLTKKGKVRLSRTKAQTKKTLDLAHDRQKSTILVEGEDIPFLRAIGVMTQDHRIKANRRSKFQQINAFLKILSEIDSIQTLPEPIRVVDFGCGNAYLTFATYHYLYHMLGKDVHIVGVDIQDSLVQKNNRIAQNLGWEPLQFVHSPIAEYQTETPPTIVTALHACDTASDDAIAQGLLWQSEIIIAAPCCHHNLQVQLKEQETPSAFAPVMRYGLLYERQADIITDTFRALILRMMGYQVGVMQFVDPDHTPKNLLLRAVRKGQSGHQPTVEEYMKLIDFWQVQPHLHQLLQAELNPLLDARLVQTR